MVQSYYKSSLSMDTKADNAVEDSKGCVHEITARKEEKDNLKDVTHLHSG